MCRNRIIQEFCPPSPEERIAYKVVEKYGNIIYCPYQDSFTPLPLKEWITAVSYKISLNISHIGVVGPSFEYFSGFHCYKDLASALAFKRLVNSQVRGNHVIYQVNLCQVLYEGIEFYGTVLVAHQMMLLEEISDEKQMRDSGLPRQKQAGHPRTLR